MNRLLAGLLIAGLLTGLPTMPAATQQPPATLQPETFTTKDWRVKTLGQDKLLQGSFATMTLEGELGTIQLELFRSPLESTISVFVSISLSMLMNTEGMKYVTLARGDDPLLTLQDPFAAKGRSMFCRNQICTWSVQEIPPAIISALRGWGSLTLTVLNTEGQPMAGFSLPLEAAQPLLTSFMAKAAPAAEAKTD